MSTPADRWSIWFTRLVQLVGLLIVVAEQAAVLLWDRKPEPWLLLVAVAMMLGGLGLRLILRGAGGLLNGGTEN